MCLARFRPVQEFDVGDSDVFWQWEALLGHLQIGLVQGKTLLGFYSPGRLILLRCLHLQIPLGILATPHLFFRGGLPFRLALPQEGYLSFRLASSQDCFFPGGHFRSGTHRRVFVVG